MPLSTEDRHELAALIAKELRENALTSEPMPALPPPQSVRHERVILGALLCGEAHRSDLPVKRHHFFMPLSREVFTLILEYEGALSVSADVVTTLAKDNRFMSEQILELMGQAWCSRSMVDAACSTVIEMWRRRTLLSELTSVCAGLRMDLQHEDAVGRLRGMI